MTSINPIATTTIAAGSSAQAGAALQGSATGVFANIAGANFFDLIISRLASAEAGNDKAALQANANGQVEAPANTAPAQPQNPLAMLQVALAAQTVDANGNIVLPAAEDSAQTLKGELNFTNQIINHLKTMLPDSAEKEGIFAKLMTKLQAKSDTLQASLSALETGVITKDTSVEDIPMPLLIAFGLKPSEIAEVSDKVQALAKKLGRDITVEDLIAGVGGIVPPAPETAVLASASLKANQQPIKAEDILSAINDTTQPSDDLAAQLNALSVGGEEPAAAADQKLDVKAGGKREMQGLPELDDKSLKDATNVDLQVKKPVNNIKDHLVNLLNTDKSTQGQMIFPVAQTGGDADAALYQQYGLTPSAQLSFGSTAQAASTIASPATAGQAHPATNLVAASIVKFAGQGENQTMKIRLDPPELGNVSVRLQFGKDKVVKAHLTVEKPETYMMLQKDGHALERALQSAGLDAQAGSISFELADQGGNAFNNNGEGGGEKNFGGGSASAQNADDGEIIQSSVTWQVDPSTGHVRYNLFA